MATSTQVREALVAEHDERRGGIDAEGGAPRGRLACRTELGQGGTATARVVLPGR
jgi:hypothetical protein